VCEIEVIGEDDRRGVLGEEESNGLQVEIDGE
jgi:hypothetical protein